ncbi:MAG: hypothetical protein ABFC91_00915 [Methanobacteriaceae archaeon]|jgi:hypothetical protein
MVEDQKTRKAIYQEGYDAAAKDLVENDGLKLYIEGYKSGYKDGYKSAIEDVKSFSVINLTPEQMKELGEAAQMPGIKFPW